MRIASTYIQQQSVDAMLNKQAELAKTQNQVSRGVRFNSASEDPIASVKTLDLERQINLSSQYLDNANIAENKLTLTEGILSNASNILQRVHELAVQGLSDSVGADGRTAIAAEINELNEALLGLANSRDPNGDSVFAGYQTDVDAFNPTTYAYNGDAGQRNIRIGDSYLVEVNEPGNEVFTANLVGTGATQPIFQTIANFATALSNNTVDTAPNNREFLSNINAGSDALLAARTRIGARLNGLETQRSISEDIIYRNNSTVSEFRDLDYAEAITRLNMQMTGLQAAQQAYVKIQGLSLFNVL